MKLLSALDALFLRLETANPPMHVGSRHRRLYRDPYRADG